MDKKYPLLERRHFRLIVFFHLLFPVIAWAYYYLARKEEKDMISKFGDAYRTYMQSVPMFFPKLKHLRLYLGQANT
jgi:protein-S-isoprenylcysteine O-methyltransferase Ste14